MLINQNLAANIISKLWGFLSLYLFMPVYFKYLGSESFGLIGLYAALAGVLMIADFGISASINRQFASLIAEKNSWKRLPDVLRTFEIAYLFPLVAAFGLFIVINFEYYPDVLNSSNFDTDDRSTLFKLIFIR